ncbi:phage protein Gp27 family protein [Allorhizobium pseudoryzae]|uniref:phage protein Gp27 family protein n=1 Tax=Allorhizobium pseudoryzae TaxID=379684 RepID=UPI003D088DEC
MKQRLSTIETLPESALKHVRWMFDTISAKRMSQTDMLTEFNRRLQGIGLTGVSRSGLNRYVMKVRDGEVLRPKPAPADEGDDDASPVFSAAFRDRLAKAQGEKAVSVLEVTLKALAL